MESILPFLFYAFLVIVAINGGYYLFFFSFAFSKKPKVKSLSKEIGVSILICSKNEETNLKINIPKWLEQDYHTFELVLINDASYDETPEIIDAFAKKDTRITTVHVENNEAFWGSKKYALTLGIKKAKYDTLLFTDADCYPKSKHWIRSMIGAFSTTKTIVLGYGAYAYKRRSLLNMLIRYETVLTAMQYFSYAVLGNPYMGVGRNLGYTKSLFFEQSGFMSHMEIASGDDDLFVNKAGTKSNTAIRYIESTHTVSEPKSSWKSWFIQKRRHISTARHYNLLDQFLLGLFYISQLGGFLVLIILLIFLHKWIWVLAIWGLRYLIVGFAIGGSAQKLKEKNILFFFPVLEVFLIWVQLSIFSANLISKPNRWK